MIGRITAIVRADFLVRFRRFSTVVLFLLLSALPYPWIPDPSTGRAIMRIGAARVLYDSAALGISTAMLAALFIGIAGFYVVSNAVQRDVSSRCGSILASTMMRSSEYIVGKFLGNTVFLATFAAGFMLTAMAMQVVRGEAPLQPWVFARQYLVLLPSSIVLISALAITFESIPLLAGRFGDVVYFFVWTAVTGVTVALVLNGVHGATYCDSLGLAFLMDHIRLTQHTTSVSIGAGPFDAAKPLVVLRGLGLDWSSFFPRLTSTLLPLLLLPVALLFFHRFDPARVRVSGPRSQHGWGARLNRLAKPLTRPLGRLSTTGGFVADALLTFALQPAAAVLFIAIAIATIASPSSIQFTFAVAALLLADIASRDARSGTTALLYAARRRREHFVVWKLASSLLVALILLSAPIIRGAVESPYRLPALLAAVFFVAAAASSLGSMTRNPKAFIVLFLSFWYVVINDRGATPALDFAGWYGRITPAISASYAAAGLVMIAAAEAVHRVRLARS